jgi:hypothetical protein
VPLEKRDESVHEDALPKEPEGRRVSVTFRSAANQQ